MVLTRRELLPETALPDVSALIDEGRGLARQNSVQPGSFLNTVRAGSEYDYKQRMMREGRTMFHAQIGYRGLDKSRRAYAEIFECLDAAGYMVDRYGICLDWSMAYPRASRQGMPKGTGLILDTPEQFRALTEAAPVAPHFGDFVLGMPAALENTTAALFAGSTTIGNLGQYFNFDVPKWDDDVYTSAETVKAIALCAAQPVPILIHSNLDDGFMSLYTDMCSAFGQVLLERYIVEDLLGGLVSHCYGHTYSDPITRLAFKNALQTTTSVPGTIVYGNTTIYQESEIKNYAGLAGYLLADILGQLASPSGHAVNPVPVTEALRIPDIDEIVDAHLFANRLLERSHGYLAVLDMSEAEVLSDRIVWGGKIFRDNVVEGLAEAGIDVLNPFEMLLALRRIGAKALEHMFGAGELEVHKGKQRRVPREKATTIRELESQVDVVVEGLDEHTRKRLETSGLAVCIASTDVHEYGKIVVESTLERVGVKVLDAGISVDPKEVVECAERGDADAIAISTYNGVALNYLREVVERVERSSSNRPIFVGGKVCGVPEDSADGLPIDVSSDVESLGVRVCASVGEFLVDLAELNRGWTT